ncbi:MAG: IS982 family transposase [Blastocatellia bacterium]
MNNQILPLFSDLDDFCHFFEPSFNARLLQSGTLQRHRKSKLTLSELMTIIIWFQQSGYRTFKDYYQKEVCKHLSPEFPGLVSYTRFVELMPSALVPLCAYLKTRKGRTSGIAFIDWLPLAVCHNRRIHSHKVFAHVAERGKSSVDWFYSFKLHLVINDCGELLAFHLTAGNVDDRKPVPKLARGLFGKLFGDRGYISKTLNEVLSGQNLELITKIKKNMRNRLLSIFDQIMLRKRALIETINDQLKNICQIEHTRHRSTANFLVNVIGALIAYTFKEKKPSLNIRVKELEQLPALV